MTLPLGGQVPKDVLQVSNLGTSTQNLNPSKMTNAAKGRMSQSFLGSAAGLPGGVATTATNLFGEFAGKIADDNDATTVENPADVNAQVTSFFGNPGTSILDLVPVVVENLITGIFSGWFGSAPDESTPERANYTIRAIKDAVLNGYIVSTFTSSGVFSVTDQMTELVVACVGGGANGSSGAQPAGGAKGLGGGYQVYTLDIAEILDGATSVAVPITIGAPGQLTTFGAVAESAPGLGGIATTFGWTPTSSTPGNGGDGGRGGQTGSATGVTGEDGGSTAMAAGGAGGLGGNGNSPNGNIGAAGGSTDPAATVKCCGAGGGGGGGGFTDLNGVVAYAGGAGGNGGYPGGGGGGGGGKGAGAGSGSPGGGGYGAAGVLFVFRKEAA